MYKTRAYLEGEGKQQWREAAGAGRARGGGFLFQAVVGKKGLTDGRQEL